MVNDNTSNQSEQLQANLLENGLDFLLSAAEVLNRDGGPRSLKDAVLHLANGIELLVKARLAREHWSLIFSDINKASYEELSKADFKSVDYPTTTKRLEQIVGVSIDKSVSTHVNSLRKIRNKLTHFTATLDPAQAKSLLAKSMNFCIEFCEQQNMVSGDVESKLGEINMNLMVLQEFVADRMKSISREWKDTVIWECPECWQEALIVDGGEVTCAFCRRKADPQELAEGHSDLPNVEDCPECGEESTFAFVLYTNEDARWVCFFCGQSGENYDNCGRCDRMTHSPESGGIPLCEACLSDFMHD